MARPLMPAQTARHALLRAALAGALVAASPFLPITLVLAVGSVPRAFTSVSEALLLLPFAILPLLVTFPLVLAISVSVGLPVTRLLHRHARENLLSYGIAGAATGALVAALSVALLEIQDGYWLIVPATLSGLVTATLWWRHRRKIAA
jgi:hypothetical protein